MKEGTASVSKSNEQSLENTESSNAERSGDLKDEKEKEMLQSVPQAWAPTALSLVDSDRDSDQDSDSDSDSDDDQLIVPRRYGDGKSVP